LRKLRAVLVAAPPLLADLIRQVLTSRLGALIVAEIGDSDAAADILLDLAPDIVIIGPGGAAGPLAAAEVRRMLPNALVLALSADLLQVLGPGEGDVNELTPESLAERLRR
jgi:hypothetical protein